MTRSALLALPALVLLAGCNALAGGGSEQVGILPTSQYDPAPLVAPDTVTAGQAFRVRITTVGPHSGWVAGRTQVTYAANVVTLVPHDRERSSGGADALFMLPHDVELRLQTPGTVTLVLLGAGGSHERTPSVRLEKTVVVR